MAGPVALITRSPAWLSPLLKWTTSRLPDASTWSLLNGQRMLLVNEAPD